MCWISYKNSPVKHIANKDITCYKTFCNSDVVWNQNKIKFLGITVWNKYNIKKLHSLYRDYPYVPYEHNPEVTIFLTKSDYDNGYYISKGYHSYSTLYKAKEERNLYEVIVKCIIPKGSAYYINGRNEVVSSNIIVTDKIIK